MATQKTPVDPFPENAEFRMAAAEGRLLLKRCGDCSELHFYPRAHCPFCLSANTRWEESSGQGTIYSFSIPRKPPGPAMAVVELKEGLRLTSVIADADNATLAIGQSVRAHWRTGPKGPELRFTTMEADRAREYADRVTAEAVDVPGIATPSMARFDRVAVIGAGTMGTGISMAMVNAGIPVLLIDRDMSTLERGMERIRSNYESSVSRGRLTAAEASERVGMVTTSTEMKDIATADVVVEAVWEQLGLKRDVFTEIDRHARAGALLGTNTSMLDINQIAAATSRPQDVIGLHFFTPAQAMKLLEVVRGRLTSDSAIASAMALARRIRKAAVLVEVCPGFVGNRMFMRRESEARKLLLEGATPEQVDGVLTGFGMPMGSFELADMTSGIELGYRKRQESGEKDWLGDRMFAAGRVGQKVGKGYYRYDAGGRKPLPDPQVLELLEEGSRAAGIERRKISDLEILERLLYPVINEGAAILDEGVALRSGDVDAVWINGYGWPAHMGGPLYYADSIGLRHVCDRLRALQQAHGDRFRPSALLERMAEEGTRFSDLPVRKERGAAFTATH